MAKVSPSEFGEKWARRSQGAIEDTRRGIANVKVAPGELAAANQEAMLQNVVASINDGTWARRVSGVSLTEWQKAATEKGLARIPQGVQAAQPKMVAVGQVLLPIIDAAAEAANRMPKVTLQDSIARMTMFVTEMHKNAPKRQGR